MMFGCLVSSPAVAQAVSVTTLDDGAGYRLEVGGQPFKIKGAGGDGDKKLLAQMGGNAFRTWGIDEKTPGLLDEAQSLGQKVALGIWLGHARHGFDYGDPAQVQKQFEEAKAAVQRFKDHPALLLWGVGNEMEEYGQTTDPRVWRAVNQVAAMIQEIDPHHPTMTVTAEIGGDKLESIRRHCPAIDVVGVNSYGGVASLPERYAAAGMKRPYVVTEFGPPGTWEIGRNAWDVPHELSSTEKAEVYRAAYAALDADPRCLGSFAFTWGNKQEATATWFGMLLPDGRKLGAVDALSKAWTGQDPPDLCPIIEGLEVVGGAEVLPGGAVSARLAAHDPEGRPLDVEWVLFKEMDEFESAGDFRPTPPTYPEAVLSARADGAILKMPDRPGNYRLFVYVRDDAKGAAVANVPLRVKGKSDALAGLASALPVRVYGDGLENPAYAPSGYMGSIEAIRMDADSRSDPRVGETCLEVVYGRADGWGGVVWQHPANDWGELPGGLDLSRADTLSFWARGAAGGEKVKFGFGLLGKDKPFSDSGRFEQEITLSREWRQHAIPLTGIDMKRIKSGFYWVAAGQGKTLRFYIDEIAYVRTSETPAEATPEPK